MPSASEAGDMLLERFGQIAYQFLDAAAEVWTEDELLKSYKAEFDAANETPSSAKKYTEQLQKKFIQEFRRYFSRIESKDETIFEEPIEFLVKLNAASKYAGASLDVRSTSWEYARQIVQAATMGDVYEKCPSKMVQRVASMADKIVKDMQSGNFDPTKLNPMELSQEMLKGIDPKSLEEWGSSLKSSGNIDHIMSMMTGMLGSGMPGMGGLGSLMQNPALKDMMGGGDMASLLSNPALKDMMSSMGGMGGGGLASMLNPASMMGSITMD
jgi:hypothetical protein